MFESSDESKPMLCPLKIGLLCPATASIISDGRCVGVCPRSALIFNSRHDPFGAAVGYRPDEFRRRDDAPIITVDDGVIV